MKRALKKSHIIKTAQDLFSQNGFYATGVDTILAQAQVSKRTLYKYFPSKNDLILAVMDQYREAFKKDMRDVLASQQDPEQKIIAVFTYLHEKFQSEKFCGCLAVSAVSEFADKDPSIIQSCQKFKKWELGMFYSLAKDMGVHDPNTLSYKLFIVFEGLISAAQVTRQAPAMNVIGLVKDILDKAKKD